MSRGHRPLARRFSWLSGLLVLGASLFALLLWRERLAAMAEHAARTRAARLAVVGAARLGALPTNERCTLVATWEHDARWRTRLVEVQGRTRCGGGPSVALGPRERIPLTLDGVAWSLASETLSNEANSERVVVAVEDARTGTVGWLLGVVGCLLLAGSVGYATRRWMLRDLTDDLHALTRAMTEMTDGHERTAAPLSLGAPDEVGVLGTAFRDLQARFATEAVEHREALARLEEAERRRAATVATLRHELRTPLNSIVGFADLLLAGGDGPLAEPQREDVAVIANAGRHLLDLVDDVFDLSAMAAGRYQLSAATCDVAALTREVVREAQGVARVREVALSVEAPDELRLQADAVALRRALTNLVLNAIEHGGQRVSVAVLVRDRTCVVAVSDTGSGLNPADLRRLFKPFERGRTAEARGAGLGLAITLALVELHRGTLSAHSEVGRGSTFTVTLPLDESPS